LPGTKSLTRFQAAEQNKKIRELGHIFNYPDEKVVKRLVAAGRGNPRLMEWLDILVGEMKEAEVPVLLEAVKDKQEELLAGAEFLKDCHGAAFAYYKKRCEAVGEVDAVLVEEWIYHALGCGEEDTASKQGGRLVKHLRERLAFRESRRVGEWVLAGKERELGTAEDAYLLNSLAYTIDDLGDHRKAIEYYEQALAILKKVYGEKHPQVAAALNNLGSAYFARGQTKKAKPYFERAYAIFKKFFGNEHPHTKLVKGWLEECS
jgi:tetratricopeptide (TPR) repeat protein